MGWCDMLMPPEKLDFGNIGPQTRAELKRVLEYLSAMFAWQAHMIGRLGNDYDNARSTVSREVSLQLDRIIRKL